MTNQGGDLLDDLQEFLEHYDYDSDDDLTSYYDSEDSFYDSEDYDSDDLDSLTDDSDALTDTDSDSDSSDSDSDSDSDGLESLADKPNLRDVLDLLLDQSDKKKKKKKKNKSAKKKARKEKKQKKKEAKKKKKAAKKKKKEEKKTARKEKRADKKEARQEKKEARKERKAEKKAARQEKRAEKKAARQERRDLRKGKKEFQKTGNVDDDSALGKWLEDLGTVSTVDQPAPASNFTKLPNSIVEEIGEIALYVTHYVAFDNILGRLLKKMGLKLGDAAKERRKTAFEKCDNKCIELSKGLLSSESIVAMKKIFIANADDEKKVAKENYEKLVKNGECSKELIRKIEELGEAAYEYQKCKVENPKKKDEIKSFKNDFNLAKKACGCIPVMAEMRLFNANREPTTWGDVKPKSIRPIVACTKTLVNECPDTEQEMAFEFTLSETKTISCTKGVEWNFNVAVGAEVGAELIVDVSASVEVSTGVTRSKELSQEVSKSNEQTYSFPLKCKGGKTVQGIANVIEQDMEVEFDQVFIIDEVEWVKHGIWRGKKNASLSYTVKEL